MGEFFIFMLILFAFGSATAFVVPYFSRKAGRLDRTVDQDTLARVLEDVDQLSRRLTQVEEEMAFYKELRGREEPDRLPGPQGGEDGQGGSGS